MKMFFRIIQIAVPFIWFGMIGAISFMEAPLKFQAPGITLALGLGIGRLIFWMLNKIEIVLAVLMLFSLFVSRPKGRFSVITFAVIAGLLGLETVWLLPDLDARATEVIKGVTVPYSNTHLFYIAFDAVKFLLLFALGWNLTKQNLKAD
jgi:hypothetical protein